MIHTMEQGTDEWKDIKRGKISATGIAKLQAGGKGKTREAYKVQLVLERLTGKTAESYSNASMERGVELEDVARQLYEARELVVVETFGFIDHPYIERYGCSPDGCVGEDGLVEIKCVQASVQYDYINSMEVPTNYGKQVQSQLGVTGRDWCDFVSYCPEMPCNLELLVIRVHRDQAIIDEANIDVVAFDAEVTAEVERLRDLTI